MEITVAKVVALVVGVGEMVGVALLPGNHNVGEAEVILGAALVLIWFSEELGGAMGFIGHGEVSSETPGWMVAGFGWCVMVGVAVFLW